MSSQPHKLVFRDVSFRWGRTPVLRNVSAEFNAGERWCVLGPNGAGKTTLVRIALGLLKPTAGRVQFDAVDVAAIPPSRRAKLLGWVPQHLDGTIDFTVRELVALGATASASLWGVSTAPTRLRIEQALDRVGLGTHADRPVSLLSGGEVRLAFLARALAQAPKFLLLDEPTTHLDPRHQAQLLNYADRSNISETTIAVLHDINTAVQFATHVLLMTSGSVLTAGPAAQVLNCENLEAAFGVPFEALRTSDGRTQFAQRFPGQRQ